MKIAVCFDPQQVTNPCFKLPRTALHHQIDILAHSVQLASNYSLRNRRIFIYECKGETMILTRRHVSRRIRIFTLCYMVENSRIKTFHQELPSKMIRLPTGVVCSITDTKSQIFKRFWATAGWGKSKVLH